MRGIGFAWWLLGLLTLRGVAARIRCGLISLPGYATYGATKAALNSFTVALRAELKVSRLGVVSRAAVADVAAGLQGTGVRVLSICPTSVTDGGAYDRLLKDIAANGNQSHARCVTASCMVCTLC